MKNIFLLPTDKPSRLYFDSKNKVCITDIEMKSGDTQNIYITDNSEIKEGDWVITNNGLLAKVITELAWHFINSKKIILTNDLDLIKDGVQPIDDEFLEWFVKNPSCQEVEVEYGDDGNGYQPILPKEEPKKVLTEEDIWSKEDIDAVTDYILKMKNKETLEEVAERLTQDYNGNVSQKLIAKTFMTVGAKWQKEQDKNKYSEEEVRELFKQYKEEFSIYRNLQILNAQFEEWFEQNKKK